MSRRLLGLAGLIGLVGLQAAIGPHLAILGVAPDLPLVAVLVVAMLSGPTRGAVTGVCVGLLLDVLRGNLIWCEPFDRRHVTILPVVGAHTLGHRHLERCVAVV